MMRPAMEEQAKAVIAQRVEGQLFMDGYATPEARAAALDASLAGVMPGKEPYTTEQTALYYDEITVFSENSYKEVMRKVGNLALSDPASINLYASSFENKDIIEAAIAEYNEDKDELEKIIYTDYVGLMMSSVTTIINAITYVLIAFVAISLVVSSIMIGVITLISVQERTKEIGILRAIGASKRNVSSMFNAETVIIGFSAGLLGVLVTYLLCIPINLILHALTDIPNLSAILPWQVAVILVGISVVLTLFAGTATAVGDRVATIYDDNIGRKATFNPDYIGYGSFPISAAPENEISWPQATPYAGDADLVMVIIDAMVVRGEYWFKVEAAEGYELPADLVAEPWIFQNMEGAGVGADSLIVEMESCQSETMLIAGAVYPRELVASRMQSLNAECIRYVLDCLREVKPQVKNMKKYLMASLFNAPATMENFMESRVQREVFAKMDMKNTETGGIDA
jgi:hypothetical protein